MFSSKKRRQISVVRSISDSSFWMTRFRRGSLLFRKLRKRRILLTLKCSNSKGISPIQVFFFFLMNTRQSSFFNWNIPCLFSLEVKVKYLWERPASSSLIGQDELPSSLETNEGNNVESSPFNDTLEKGLISYFAPLSASEQTSIIDSLDQWRSRPLVIRKGCHH